MTQLTKGIQKFGGKVRKAFTHNHKEDDHAPYCSEDYASSNGIPSKEDLGYEDSETISITTSDASSGQSQNSPQHNRRRSSIPMSNPSKYMLEMNVEFNGDDNVLPSDFIEYIQNYKPRDPQNKGRRRERMPRRVSLEYCDAPNSNGRMMPNKILLEYGDAPSSSEEGAGSARRIRRLSLGGEVGAERQESLGHPHRGGHEHDLPRRRVSVGERVKDRTSSVQARRRGSIGENKNAGGAVTEDKPSAAAVPARGPAFRMARQDSKRCTRALPRSDSTRSISTAGRRYHRRGSHGSAISELTCDSGSTAAPEHAGITTAPGTCSRSVDSPPRRPQRRQTRGRDHTSSC